jgi:hypothetical protein
MPGSNKKHTPHKAGFFAHSNTTNGSTPSSEFKPNDIFEQFLKINAIADEVEQQAKDNDELRQMVEKLIDAGAATTEARRFI